MGVLTTPQVNQFTMQFALAVLCAVLACAQANDYNPGYNVYGGSGYGGYAGSPAYGSAYVRNYGPDTLPTDIWTGTDTASTTPDMETSTPPPTLHSERFPPDTEPDMALLLDTMLDMGLLDTMLDMGLPDTTLDMESPDITPDMEPLGTMPDMGPPDMELMAASTNIII